MATTPSSRRASTSSAGSGATGSSVPGDRRPARHASPARSSTIATRTRPTTHVGRAEGAVGIAGQEPPGERVERGPEVVGAGRPERERAPVAGSGERVLVQHEHDEGAEGAGPDRDRTADPPRPPVGRPQEHRDDADQRQGHADHAGERGERGEGGERHQVPGPSRGRPATEEEEGSHASGRNRASLCT